METIEALWSVTVEAACSLIPGAALHGGGIVVLENGKALGGDTDFTYVGTYRYTRDTRRLEIELELARYRERPDSMSVFGPAHHFHLRLEGDARQERFVLARHVAELPARRMTMEFIRRAELP